MPDKGYSTHLPASDVDHPVSALDRHGGTVL
jgi:hypothetical protein